MPFSAPHIKQTANFACNICQVVYLKKPYFETVLDIVRIANVVHCPVSLFIVRSLFLPWLDAVFCVTQIVSCLVIIVLIVLLPSLSPYNVYHCYCNCQFHSLLVKK